MKYRHISTGQLVHSDNPELPRAFYEPIDEPESADKPEVDSEPAKGEEQPSEGDTDALEGMTKAELSAYAESIGAEVPAKATKAQIIDAIRKEG